MTFRNTSYLMHSSILWKSQVKSENNVENKMSEKFSLAIIGGSGLYSMPDLTDITEIDLDTPFGKPSAPILVGTLGGKRIAFLARHGIGHHITPSEVPYRANIFALKMMGAERIVSINACGSLREEYAPGQIVIPDQLFDHTTARAVTFFGEGLVAHAGVADPFCQDLSGLLETAVKATGSIVHPGGTFIIIEGPRFSTKAESKVYRSWGMSIIGMTAAPEAFLAREAEMCYSVMAHITDYDVWHDSAEPVSIEIVMQTLNKNTQAVQAAIQELVSNMPEERRCTCQAALASAIITQPASIPNQTRQKLDLLVKKYLPNSSKN
jgi:5'-methylthioadenosine phosphorylase